MKLVMLSGWKFRKNKEELLIQQYYLHNVLKQKLWKKGVALF